jgi:hypothetical protein
LHRFACYPSDRRKLPPDLHGAHLVGSDNVALRADITWESGSIRCTPRIPDPIGLSLLWPVPDFGTIQLQTTRVPTRAAPYNLHVELARHQLMRLTVKREEWGLFDYPGMDEIATRVDRCRDLFVLALQNLDAPATAARHADQSLLEGLLAGEEMSRFHASVFLVRRQQSGGFSRPFLGIVLPDGAKSGLLTPQLAEIFDLTCIPFVWRSIQPTEQAPSYNGIDACVKAAAAAGQMIRGGPLLNFGVQSVPDWMYIWEHDFEAIYEAAREHVEHAVRRFSKQISSWIVVSGLQADNVFGFSFEQTMELTRMAATVAKQVAPRAQVLIDLTQPWGEYYARNQQTVPPLLYADMAVQSGINFDGFGLQFIFGLATDGYHVRDPFQVSSLIDKVANLGKALHVTALAAPSQPTNGGAGGASGEWHAPWSDEVQADWLTTVCEIALSKPYVESVCLEPLVDGPGNILTSGGLLRQDLTAKPALAKLSEMRKRLLAGPGK